MPMSGLHQSLTSCRDGAGSQGRYTRKPERACRLPECKPGVSPRAFFLVLPIFPGHMMDFQVAGNGRANGWEKIVLAKLRKQSKSLQLVFYRIFEFGKAKLDTLGVQRLVKFRDCIAGGDVHTGDRLRRNDQPTYRRRRFRHRIQSAFLEEFGVGEE